MLDKEIVSRINKVMQIYREALSEISSEFQEMIATLQDRGEDLTFERKKELWDATFGPLKKELDTVTNNTIQEIKRS